MFYDKRNRENLDELADNTKQKAYLWYNYCKKNNIEVLIYDAIRTKAEQEQNVKNGVSKIMKSYHIVGQAFDWALVDSRKQLMWSGYETANAQKLIKYAKSIGFVSGYDWGWDAPHLQFEHKGYGTDTFGKLKIVEVEEDMKLTDTGKSSVKSIIKKARDKGFISKDIHTDSKIDKYDDAQLINYGFASLDKLIK